MSDTLTSHPSPDKHEQELEPQHPPKDLRFWLIFLALCVSLFLSALEFAAVGNALPSIVAALQGQDSAEFTWVGSAYTLASTAFLPMSGGTAEIFGRRGSFIGALLIFALGSALCGSAQNMRWLIGARTVQGIGGGGIMALSSIVVSDMVPLSERGAYNGLIGMTWTFAVAIGPLIGGALAQAGQWRWLFYLNLPIVGIALVLVEFFMDLPTPAGTLSQKLKKMDWIGNTLVIASSTSVVIALTWGGTRYPWSSARIITPLVLGLVGLGAFALYESRFATYPMFPRTLLANRTSFSGYMQVFLNSIAVVVWTYYIPVYFQACRDASPIRSSVEMFGVTFVVGPMVVIGGVSASILKKYRPQMWFGWILAVIGAGAFSTVGANTPLSQAIGLPAIGSSGSGFLLALTYFPVLSPLPVSENAHALALFAFLRAFASVWGITIGSTILTNQLRVHLPTEILDKIPGGLDVVYSVIPQIKGMMQPTKDQVREAFAHSLRAVWYTNAGILGLGLLFSLLMADIPMHSYVDEKWSKRAESGEKPVDGRQA
jgi:EmrB/QacA subfamily drug resistance transporter